MFARNSTGTRVVDLYRPRCDPIATPLRNRRRRDSRAFSHLCNSPQQLLVYLEFGFGIGTELVLLDR